ncbi:MAG: VanZ family protein, partial [Gammaproteobacteria bacterium]
MPAASGFFPGRGEAARAAVYTARRPVVQAGLIDDGVGIGMGASYIRIFRGLFVLVFAAVAYLSLMQMPETGLQQISDKVHHAFAFYVLALLLDFAQPRSEFGLRKFSLLMAYGVAIECVQYFLPWREFSLLDMVADAVGLLLYVAGIPLLKRVPVLR